MGNRNILVSSFLAILTFALGYWAMQRAGESTDTLASKRRDVENAGASTRGRVPVQSATQPGSAPFSLDALADRLAAALTSAGDKARARDLASRARESLEFGEGSRYDAALIDLREMEKAAAVECVVKGDLDALGAPAIAMDSASGRVVLRGRCWAEGPGDDQRNSRDHVEHVADFHAAPSFPDERTAEASASRTAASGYVYGVKRKGETSVRWVDKEFSDEIGD